MSQAALCDIRVLYKLQTCFLKNSSVITNTRRKKPRRNCLEEWVKLKKLPNCCCCKRSTSVEKNWWLNLNQDKQNEESLCEQTGAFAAPSIKDIYPATITQCKDSFSKQRQQKTCAISGWLKSHVHSPKIVMTWLLLLTLTGVKE